MVLIAFLVLYSIPLLLSLISTPPIFWGETEMEGGQKTFIFFLLLHAEFFFSAHVGYKNVFWHTNEFKAEQVAIES